MATCTLAAASAADYRGGAARVEITPKQPIRLAGYAARTTLSSGVTTPLWAKALAIQYRTESPVILITTDLLGLPRSVTDVAAAEIQKQHGLDRSRVLFNSSHTHAGPIIWPSGRLAAELADEQKRVVMEYRNFLVEQLVSVATAALQNSTPVEVAFGTGEAHFAVNRRQKTSDGVRIGVNPSGPTDPQVPVLRIRRLDGSMLAVLFGYACHNTTLVANNLQISGDYAGEAQARVEEKLPGATAMFLMLCGADQNPNPRGQPEHVTKHGGDLAAAVLATLERTKEMKPISGRIRAAFSVRDLPLAEPFAKPVPYPVQAVRFGNDLTLVALGGEVVVDYDLRIRREFAKHNIVVAGYSNDVMAYIPTKAILAEGGYEPVDSMKYYDLPSPFHDDVEDLVMGSVRDVLRRVGVR